MKSWKITALLYLLLALGAWTAWRVGTAPGPGDETSAAVSEEEKARRLNRLLAALADKRVRKEAVIRRLFDGEIGLLEAAGLFGRIDAGPPEFATYLRPCIEGATEEEKLCRQVLFWANAESQSSSCPNVKALVAELEAELDSYLGEQGQPVLPELP
jgi:hypothetical protein